jgi:hypothetical protein
VRSTQLVGLRRIGGVEQRGGGDDPRVVRGVGLAGLIAIVALGIVAGACGGSNADSSTATTTKPVPVSAAQRRTFRECMRSHRVALPGDHTTTSSTPIDHTAIVHKCMVLGSAPSKAQAAVFEAAVAAYGQCMTNHGYAMHLPSTTTPAGRSEAVKMIFGHAEGDPAYSPADAVCRPMLRKALGAQP